MKHSLTKCRFPHRKYTVLYSVHVQWPIGHVYFCMVTWNVYFGVKKVEHQAVICYRNCLMMYLQHILSRGWCRITTLSFRGVNICQNCTIRILNGLYLGYYLSNVFFIVQVESSTLCLWLTGILTIKILFVLEFWPPKLGSRWTKLHF